MGPTHPRINLNEDVIPSDTFNVSSKEPPIVLDSKGTEVPSSAMKATILRAVATVLTLGTSEILLSGRDFLDAVIAKNLTGKGFDFLAKPGTLTKEDRANAVEAFKAENHTNASSDLKIPSTDGVILDGKMIEPKTPQGDPKKYVIWLNGWNESYENKLNKAVEYADKSGATIVMFNYRGSGDSTGLPNSGQDFVRDTVSVVNGLKKSLGVEEKDITIHGYSMGGGIGSKAASYLNNVQVINDRSFTTFSASIKEFVARETRQTIGKTASNALGSLAGALVKQSSFEFNTEKVYKKQNRDDPNSLENRTLFLYHPSDEMIVKSSLAQHKINNTNDSNLLPSNIVNLRGSEEENIDNKLQLETIADHLKSEYGIKSYQEFSRDEVEAERTPTDYTYRSFLISKVEFNIAAAPQLDQDPTNLIKTLNELRELTLPADIAPGASVHGTFILNFPAASKVIDFIGGEPRFAEATPSNPQLQFTFDRDAAMSEEFNDIFKPQNRQVVDFT